MPPLACFQPFAALGAARLAQLEAQLVHKRARRGDDLLHKGQPVSGAYLVLSGRLRVFTVAANGTQATLYFLHPGDTCVLALNCLFNDLRYPAWVEAEEPTDVVMVPGPIYRQLFDTEPSIRNLTVQTLSTLVFRLMAELEDVHACPHRQRLANFLLQHASGDGDLQITQQQLAQHLGTSREVIARLIGELADQGMLRTGRGRIAIADLPGLQAVARPPA